MPQNTTRSVDMAELTISLTTLVCQSDNVDRPCDIRAVFSELPFFPRGFFAALTILIVLLVSCARPDSERRQERTNCSSFDRVRMHHLHLSVRLERISSSTRQCVHPHHQDRCWWCGSALRGGGGRAAAEIHLCESCDERCRWHRARRWCGLWYGTRSQIYFIWSIAYSVEAGWHKATIKPVEVAFSEFSSHSALPDLEKLSSCSNDVQTHDEGILLGSTFALFPTPSVRQHPPSST